MEELVNDFEHLKLSAFTKLHYINRNNPVKNITIGASRLGDTNASEVGEKGDSKPEDVTKNSHITALPIKQVLKEIEFERQAKVQDAMNSHLNKFHEFSRNQENLKKQRLWQKQQDFIKTMQLKEIKIQEILQQDQNNFSQQQAKLIQDYKDWTERKKKHVQQLKDIEVLKANMDKLEKYQIEFRSVYQEIVILLKKIHHNDELKIMLTNVIKQLKVLPEGFQEIITKLKTSNITDDDVKKGAKLVLSIKSLKDETEACVMKVVKMKAQVEPEVVQTTTPVNEIKQPQPVNVPNNPPITTSIATIDAPSVKKVSLADFVSMSNLQHYTEVTEFLEQHSLTFTQLLDDGSLKQFRFDCKKAINIPVNSISGVNSEHLLDKYNRLRNLLTGQTVYVSDKPINASKHPQGIAFCLDLLAKKFVLQGDLMISSNPESAFCYATIIVSLWNEFPEFGKLLLGYFYKSCPYLVPYYLPRNVDETDEEYYIRQGYQYTDGKIERQDKFLKRMTGIMRLYAAILIVKPKKGQTSVPYNIDNGWRWLSSILKLEPRVDITATMVHTFLETAGSEMEARYGRMFQKLLKIIMQKLLPSCREKCTGGAVTRLELLLTEYMKNGKFERPNGYVPYPYW